MIKRIDHVVITTANPEVCIEFYKKLGFTPKRSIGRFELHAGDFKINVHVKGAELTPHAGVVTIGSADLCFEISEDAQRFMDNLEKKGVRIELGVVIRHGFKGEMRSVYVRDPDENLLEFCQYPLTRD